MTRLAFLSLLTLPLGLVCADGMYTKGSPVLQVNAKTYDSLIAQSNHTSILEFYAPWCGHCQSLKPAYEKAAKNLAGLAKVAAINCDDETNKPFCGQMGVQGFPTLKIIKPGSKPGKPVVEDYQGARTAKAIVDTMVERIPSHVKKLQDTSLESWLDEDAGKAKAILFTEKGTVSALIRSLAIDFLGGIKFAQIRSKETAAVEKFGIKAFPSVLLIPGEGQESTIYLGEMKKELLIAFLSQVVSPNPDPAPKKAKSTGSSKGAKSSPARPAASKASQKPPVEFEDFQEIVLDDNTPLESPIPIVETSETPIPIPEVIPAIPLLATAGELEAACLNSKSGNCVLVLLPAGSGPDSVLPERAARALTILAQLADKHAKRNARIFPFCGIPAENEAGNTVRSGLGLKPNTELEIISVNMKRGWWRLYGTDEVDHATLETFVDGIKLGEGTKTPLPVGFFAEGQPELESVPTTDEAQPANPTADMHDEL